MSWRSLSASGHHKVAGLKPRIAVRNSSVAIYPGRDVIADRGWEIGETKLDIIVGAGRHLGMVRIVAQDDARWMLRASSGGPHGQSVCIKFDRTQNGEPALPLLPERLPSTAVDFKPINGGFEFRLPWMVSTTGDAAVARRGDAVSPDPAHAVEDKRETSPNAAPAPAATYPAPDDKAPTTVFPVQEETLAEALENAADLATPSPAPSPMAVSVPRDVGKAYGRMSAEQTEEFVQAAARDDPNGELAKIIAPQYSAGSAIYLRNMLFDRIEAAREASRNLGTASLPKNPPAEAPVVVSSVSPTVLKFLVDEVVPVLRPLGKEVKKTRDSTGLLLDGEPVTLEQIVDEANRILRQAGDDVIAIPEFAS